MSYCTPSHHVEYKLHASSEDARSEGQCSLAWQPLALFSCYFGVSWGGAPGHTPCSTSFHQTASLAMPAGWHIHLVCPHWGEKHFWQQWPPRNDLVRLCIITVTWASSLSARPWSAHPQWTRAPGGQWGPQLSQSHAAKSFYPLSETPSSSHCTFVELTANAMQRSIRAYPGTNWSQTEYHLPLGHVLQSTLQIWVLDRTTCKYHIPVTWQLNALGSCTMGSFQSCAGSSWWMTKEDGPGLHREREGGVVGWCHAIPCMSLAPLAAFKWHSLIHHGMPTKCMQKSKTRSTAEEIAWPKADPGTML